MVTVKCLSGTMRCTMANPHFACVALLLLLFGPLESLGGGWVGGLNATYTIKSMEVKGAALNGPEILVAEGNGPPRIYAVGSIRRKRVGSGTEKASIGDLRPGVRIRAHGNHSSSPYGFIADNILIVKEKNR